jgi:hypothetical protein
MYTGEVVRLRSFAFMLALLLTATPVLGVVCVMDCDQPPATSDCHKASGSSDAPKVSGDEHGCDHAHTMDGPALVASTSARDSVGTFAALTLVLADVSLSGARTAIPALHGPPRLSNRSTPTSFPITILRI